MLARQRQPAQTIAGPCGKGSLPSSKSQAIPRMLPQNVQRRQEAAFPEETKGFRPSVLSLKTHAGESDKHVKPQSPHFKVVGFRQRAGVKFLFESAHYSRSYDLVMMPHNLEMRGWGSKTYPCKSRVYAFSKHRAALSISCSCKTLTKSACRQALVGSRNG